MGWFKSETEITEFQKAIVVAMAGTFLGEDNPELEKHLKEVRKRIGISEEIFNQYIETLHNLFDNYGIYAFESFKSLRKETRSNIKDIFLYTYNKSTIKYTNPNFNFLYTNVLRFLRVK